MEQMKTVTCISRRDPKRRRQAMRMVKEQMETISSYDLAHGRLIPAAVIREDAVPVDDRTKFAWAEEDYEGMYLGEEKR